MSRFDMSEINRATRRLYVESKKTMAEVTKDAARGFLTGTSRKGNPFGIVLFSPPASKGSTGGAAKKAGELSIRKNLAYLFKIAMPGQHGPFPDAYAEHKNWQNPKTGHIRSTRKKITVDAPQVQALLKTLIGRVGWLAAGWLGGGAMTTLEVKRVPAWIKRHVGKSPGVCRITVRRYGVRIELTNGVQFVGLVKDYERRIEKAIQYEANAMNRQADFLMQKALKKSAW